MSTQQLRGFTIVETMLVLAITGLLVAGIFVGVGTSLNIQRYRDAVQTLKTDIQEQYAALNNIRNDRTNEWSCTPTAATEAGQIPRGQSDCVMLGRLLMIDGGQTRLYTVLGRPVTSPGPIVDDIQSLRDNYVLNVSSVEVEEGALEWGASIDLPVSGGGSAGDSLSLLLLRSPDSGTIYSFVNTQTALNPSPNYLNGLLVSGNQIPGQGDQVVCIRSNGLVPTDTQSIYIDRFASSPAAIETTTNELLGQKSGVPERC